MSHHQAYLLVGTAFVYGAAFGWIACTKATVKDRRAGSKSTVLTDGDS